MGQLEKWKADGTLAKVQGLAKYADEKLNGATVGQLALAWCIRNENVTTVLLGATKTEQILDNLMAVSLAQKMTHADDEALEKILGNAPEAWNGFRGQGMRQLKRMGGTFDSALRVVNPMLGLKRLKHSS